MMNKQSAVKNFLILFIIKYLSNYSGLSKTSWIYILITIIESSAIGLVFFLSLYFVEVLHFNITQTGVIISCYGLGTIIGSIVGGQLTDRVSPKLICGLSVMLQAAAFFSLIQLTAPTIIMMDMFIIGVGTYTFLTANNILVLRQYRENSAIRFKIINIIRVASNLGMGLSGVLLGLLQDVNQLKVVLYFCSMLLLFSGIYFLINKDHESPLNTPKQIREVKQVYNRLIYIMLACLFLIGLIISQLSSTYPIYIQNLFREMGLSSISILFILDTLLIVFFQAPLVNFFYRFNKIIMVGCGALLMGIGMFVLNFAYTFFIAIISCIVWTAGEMIFIAMVQFVCYEHGLENKKGHIMGIYQAVSASSKVIGPTLGSAMYSYFGGKFLWSCSMLIGLLSFLACIYVKNDEMV